MAEEKKIQLTISNEKLIEKIEHYAAYGFSIRREFVCAAVIAYDNSLMADARMERFAKDFAKESFRILEEREAAGENGEMEHGFL